MEPKPVYGIANSLGSASQVLFLNANTDVYVLSTPNICIYNTFSGSSGAICTLNCGDKLNLPGLSTDTTQYPLVYFYLTFLTSIC